MIAGLDHLACSVTDLKRGIARFEEHGFRLLFKEENLENDPRKSKLIRKLEPVHDLAFMEHENGFRVELTKYGDQLYQPEAPFSIHLNNPGLIKMKTSRPDEDAVLLTKGLRFRPDEQVAQEYGYTLSSPVSKWKCSLQMIADPELPANSTLDSSGYPCLALLSTSLQKDSEKLRILGAFEMTPPIRLIVYNKEVTIIMFRFPGGAIGELIEITQKNS